MIVTVLSSTRPRDPARVMFTARPTTPLAGPTTIPTATATRLDTFDTSELSAPVRLV